MIGHTIPDAMILDLMMPGIDGFEVLKNLREAEQTAAIPVLILTAKHITKEELRFLTRNNVHQLIQKGDIHRNDLINAVETMILPETSEIRYNHPKPLALTHKPLILIVEDNPDNMLTVKALLADNYSIIEAENGHQAVEQAQKHHPNLILMDIALPGIDGIEAFKAIRASENLKDIHIIALTASAMTSDRETILTHGFDAYIAKPIDEIIFFNTINETLYGK
jgi:CheY-like chemotaxis protein